MERKTIDPVTVEVIRNYCLSTAREMRDVIIRTSFNPTIYEVRDFAIGIYNRKAELVAQDPGIPIFIGSLDSFIKTIVGYLGEDNIHEGDVIVSNYPYFTGAHPPDVTVLKPIFIDNEIFAYTVCKAHWIDVGGIDVFSINTTDVYQEGFILPAVKVVKRGVVDQEIIDIIGFNNRSGVSCIGDLRAQIAGCQAGEKRILKAVEKYGKEVVADAIAQFLDNSERIFRKSIEDMPDGEWSAQAFIDNDGITDVPVPVKLTVRIKGSDIEVDTTGSSPATQGPLNCPYAGTVAYFRYMLMSITDPFYKPNGGCFRPLKVIIPEGSMFNPRPPSPTELFGWAANQVANLFHKCLVDAIPDKIVARSGGEPCSYLWSVKNPRDGSSMGGGSAAAMGEGAGIDNDGENALVVWQLGDCWSIPVEIWEERYPVFIEKHTLWKDSSGAGKFRGGLGTEHVFRMEDEMHFISTLLLTKYPAWGLKGGKSALPSSMVAHPGMPEEVKEKFATTLYEGEYLIEHPGGGGGFGDPYQRDPQRVLDDVIDEYVSIEKAGKDYGVAIKKERDDYIIDWGKTERLRGKSRSQQA